MEKRKKKRWIAFSIYSFFLTALAVYAFVYIGDSRMHRGVETRYLSERGYARALGVKHMYHQYFYEAYGPPERMEYRYDEEAPRTLAVAYYPQFELHCVVKEKGLPGSDSYYLRLICLSVTDPALRFGRAQIGLGSTRAEVEAAYRDNEVVDKYLHESLLPADTGYYGDRWSRILFSYDENDRVKAMVLENPAN